MRVWPFAALAVYLAPVGTFPYHAFQGLSIPLAVLAVQGVLSVWPRPRAGLVVACLALMIVPGIVHKLRRSRSTRSAPRAIRTSCSTASSRRSTRSRRDPRPGGVLAPAYGGHMLPYKTGREVYVGALSWTPDWDARVRETRALFEGDMGAGRGAGARAPLGRAVRVRRLPAGPARPAAACSGR